MKRTPRKFKAKARALTEPQPSYVSMVTAGANQQPWQRIVKMDGGAAPPVVEPQEEFRNMTTKEALESVCKGDYDISQIVFRGAAFDTEQKVKAWLDEGGYQDADIAAGPEDGTFEVIDERTFETGSTRRIDVADGVAVYIGKPTSDKVERSADEEVTEKTEENPNTVVSTAPDAAETAEKADDKPKGRMGLRRKQKEEALASGEAVTASEDELAAAVQKAEEMLADLKKKGINDVCELGFILTRLKWMVEDAPYTGISEDAVGTIKTAAASLVGALGNIMDQSATDLAEAFKAAEDPATNSSKEAEGEPAGENAENDDEENTEVDPTTAAILGVTEALKGLQTLVTEQGAAIKKVRSDVEEVGEVLDERVEALENAGQSRKSAAEIDNPQPTVDPEQEKREKQLRQRRINSMLGYERSHDDTLYGTNW